MTNVDEALVDVVVRWPGDDTPDEPGVTYVNASDVPVTVRVLRNFTGYRRGRIVHTDLVTAAKWVERRFAQVLADPPAAPVDTSDGGEVGDDGGQKVPGAGESRPRASRRRRRDDAADDGNHASDAEPVQSVDAGGRGDSAG